MIYRIAKWHEVFETAESRRHKYLRWISFPVGFDSSGYNEMVETFGDDAPSIYGAWCALLSVAARSPIRGTLANTRNQPYSVSYIAAQTRFPSDVIQELIHWASLEGVGWLEVSDESGVFPKAPPSDGPAVAQPSPGLHNITRHNNTIHNQAASAAGAVVPQPIGSDTPEPAKKAKPKPSTKNPKPTEPPSSEQFPVKRSKQHDAIAWFLPQSNLAEYERVYGDHLNVPRELAKARQWLAAHNDRRKTAGGMLKFLTAWLNRASDSSRGRSGAVKSQEVFA